MFINSNWCMGRSCDIWSRRIPKELNQYAYTTRKISGLELLVSLPVRHVITTDVYLKFIMWLWIIHDIPSN